MGNLNIFHKDSEPDYERRRKINSSEEHHPDDWRERKIKGMKSWITHELKHNKEYQTIIDETNFLIAQYREEIKRLQNER